MEDFEKTLIGLLAAQNPANHSQEFKSSLWEKLDERMYQEELDLEDLAMVAAGVRSQEVVKKVLDEKGEKL